MIKFFSKSVATILVIVFVVQVVHGQPVTWSSDGNAYYRIEKNEIVRYALPANAREVLVSAEMLTVNGATLALRSFYFSDDQKKVLLYTNTKGVWRLDTQGDYWVLDLTTKLLQQVGQGLPASSLRFAKFSPDANKVAYVSEFNLYAEDLATRKISKLTPDGNRKVIYGTFDWAYEEEFSCRDGFQWSPDGARIAFWKIDASAIPDYYMINNTDSVYSQIIPVEYPKVGLSPSPAKIGVIELSSNNTTWLAIPGDPREHYLPRMEWNTPTELFVQQLNRKQNESKLLNCNVLTNKVSLIFQENDPAWIDVLSPWENVYSLSFRHKFNWINKNQEFVWFSEKDGWRHLYRIKKDGKATLITKGNYDVLDLVLIDEKANVVYFYASPENATQKYLYKTKLDGTGKVELVSPATQKGTHSYTISPNGKFAIHAFQNSFTKPIRELVTLPDHKPLLEKESIQAKLTSAQEEKHVEFFKVKISDGTEMDGMMVKPVNFDPTKKYPVVFYVYTEPWGANVIDQYGAAKNSLYEGNMAEDGYIYITIDNRGTPVPKGRAWRKSIYRKIGQLNISDQAQAAKEVMKWSFVDAERIAVWGWSGGGAATLNLMFQYPEIYKTGIAIAAIVNQLTYDNIYQERYMGLPQENLDDFIAGSPMTYAKNLQGNLLYIHGTADDNVHYSNAEILINELVKYKKQFQLMAYPNRSHSISEGEGTHEHLSALYTQFLKKHCPPGGR
jgi:dipeptidyl-peptidase 4